MKDKLTVLIPTSPIPSHPSTAILDETIANIRKYTDAKIIIMFDGVHPSLEHRRKDYEAYQNEVNFSKPEYGDYQCFFFAEHVHQAIMTRYVLMNLVSTPLVMFCEHDTSPIGEIPFNDICDVVLNSKEINCVRFNIFDTIPDEHQYLMLDRSHYNALNPIPLTRTIQWSQRPHIAKTDWYKEILTAFLKDKKGMIEDVMHSVVQVRYNALGRDLFGLAIYTPEGNQLRSYHSDGRGGDEKIIES